MSRMSVTVPEIISHYSAMGYSAGDIISTGTVSGVAGFSDDAASLYLKPGDVVEAEIEGVGVLRNPIISWEEGHPEAGRATARRSRRRSSAMARAWRSPPAGSAGRRAGEVRGVPGDPVRDRAVASPRRARRRRGAGFATRVGPGPAAPQPDARWPRSRTVSCPPTDEQCLNLNVFTPALDERRPVFVWLHGGGFAIGHAGASLYSRRAPGGGRRRGGRHRQLPAGQPRLARPPVAGARVRTRPPATGACSTRSLRSNGCARTSLPSAAIRPRSSLAGQSAGRAVRRSTCSSAPAAHGLFRSRRSSSRRRSATSPRRRRRRSGGREALSAAAGGGRVRSGPSARTRRRADRRAARGAARAAGVPREPGAARSRPLDAGSLPDSPARLARREPRGRRAGRPHRRRGHVLLPRAVAPVAAA